MKKIYIIMFFTLFITGCQSGCTSRYTGGVTDLPTPKDCVKVINMGKGTKVKFLVYLNTKGEIIMKEFSDAGIFEASYRLGKAKFNKKLEKISNKSVRKR